MISSFEIARTLAHPPQAVLAICVGRLASAPAMTRMVYEPVGIATP
jgi:hypothetical protein